MDGKTRVGMTVFIWLTLLTAITLIITLTRSIDNGVIYALIGTTAMVLIFSTGFLWNWGRLPLTSSTGAYPNAEKNKRPDRVNAILNALTDDELEALRYRLSEPHHEEVPLERLLDQDGELRRYS